MDILAEYFYDIERDITATSAFQWNWLDFMPRMTAEEAVNRWRAFRTDFQDDLFDMHFKCI
jgi:hypothetical protein